MKNNEQRQEYRLSAQETVFIELASADPTNESPTDIIISNSVDISANGMRIIADRELPIGTILRACVQLKDDNRGFLLVTEVKWCKPHEQEGEFVAGLSLFESDGTDIQHWKEVIGERFNE